MDQSDLETADTAESAGSALLNRKLLGKSYERFNSTGTDGDNNGCTIFKRHVQPTKLFIISSVSAIVLGISTVLTVFVAIPAYMQFLTWKNDITISSIALINPSEDGFQSSVVESFSANCPVSAEVKMNNDVTLSWHHAGGGEVVKLTDSSVIPVSTELANLNSVGLVVNRTAFTNFNSYAISADYVDWQIKGTAVVSAFVDATVSVNKVVRLSGFSGFSVPPVVESLNVTDGSIKEMIASLRATLTSTSDIELHFGQELLFSIFSNNIYVGYGVIADAKMLRGPFTVLSDTHLTYTSDGEKTQLMDVLSNYSNGIDAAVTMRDFRTLTPVSWIQPALSTISLSAVFPGMKDKFIQSSILYKPRNPLNGVDFTLDLYNPQHCAIVITGLVAMIFYEDKEIGSLSEPTGLSISIPPLGRVTSPILHADPHPAGVQAYKDLINAGFGYVDVQSVTYLSVVDFASELNLRQDGIPTTVVSN
jgi:hypothetical protein